MERNNHEQKNLEFQKPEDEEPEKKIKYMGIKAMPYIIGNETFEKLGAIGTLSNLQVYLTTIFNMSRLYATTLLNIFGGTTNFATLVGAYLCDTFFGRYHTLAFASITSLLGFLVITLTAAVKNLHPPQCIHERDPNSCEGPDAGQMAFLLLGFALMVVGAGGIRPCNLAFGVDQFDPNTDSGKRGINSFFNWYYFTITFAQMVSVTLVVYVQSSWSWSIGFTIPTVFMFISCMVYFMGNGIYVRVRPEGSPMTSLAQVIVAAVKKRNLDGPPQPWHSLFNYVPKKSINSRLPYTHQLRFLDKAAIKTPQDKLRADGSVANPWSLCTMQQVEEAKCVVRVIPISFMAIIYHMGAQQQYVVFQALQSDRHLPGTKFQIPAATYSIFSMLTLIVWVPIYDRYIVLFIRRITKTEGGITILQRLGVGLFITIVESIVGAVVEDRRRSLALKGARPGNPPGASLISPMSAMWLIPQLMLGGLAEAFNAIGQTEFYYKQFPENMRSFAGAFFFCGNAVSNYFYSFLISIVHRMTEGAPTGNWLPEDLNKGRLDYFYYLVAGLCALNLGYFLLCAKWFKYKGSGEGSHIAMEMEEREHVQGFA